MLIFFLILFVMLVKCSIWVFCVPKCLNFVEKFDRSFSCYCFTFWDVVNILLFFYNIPYFREKTHVSKCIWVYFTVRCFNGQCHWNKKYVFGWWEIYGKSHDKFRLWKKYFLFHILQCSCNSSQVLFGHPLLNKYDKVIRGHILCNLFSKEILQYCIFCLFNTTVFVHPLLVWKHCSKFYGS